MSRAAPAFGAFVLALDTTFLATFGPSALSEPGVFLLCSGLLVGAALAIASDLTGGFAIGSVTVPRTVLLGSSHVAIAIAVAALGAWIAVTAAATTTRLVAIGTIVGSAPLARLGVRTARDDRRVPDRTPSLRRRLGIGLLVVASIGAGLVVATII
ncbi:hypothetical protein [Halosolutus gelatinilyticus]|uniref:hypothetical protein n=1 Tax=Halosolutus gelatinilyticus TaxID=2931975 RepID=UPI001FF35622|nr:hypothetical protein [Halosolutus gelatinilyticus]